MRTRLTTSRQLTIQRDTRKTYGIKPLDEVEVLDINQQNNHITYKYLNKN